MNRKTTRITGNIYAGEVMNVQWEDDGTYYVEIPELDWHEYDFSTPHEAAKRGLDKAQEAIAMSPNLNRQEVAATIQRLLERIEERQATIAEHEAAIAKLSRDIANDGKTIADWRLTQSGKYDLSEGLLELPEDELRVMAGMNFLLNGAPIPHVKAVAFRLHRDVDKDGDMDHAYILCSGHPKLVK